MRCSNSGVQQLLPVRFEIEDHAPPGPWQSGPTDEQHQEDHVGEGGSHPNHLMEKKEKKLLGLSQSDDGYAVRVTPPS